MVLPERIELSTSPLPRECSTTELRQRSAVPTSFLPMRAQPHPAGKLSAAARPSRRDMAGMKKAAEVALRGRYQDKAGISARLLPR